MIQEAYCSDDVCKLLKEKGFKEPCTVLNRLVIESGEKPFTKITHQKAMAWLREVHKLYITITHRFSHNADQDICFGYYINVDRAEDGEYMTYEAAVEAALKYTLENLI